MKQLLCFCTLFFISLVSAQETPFHYFNTVSKYNESIKCLSIDENGRLLLGTQNGLVIYNGYTSKKTLVASGINKDINSIYVTKKGTFVLNSQGIVLQLVKDSLKAFSSKNIKAEVKFIELKENVLRLYTKREKLSFNAKTKSFISSELFMYAEGQNQSAQYFGTKKIPFHVSSENELILVNDQEARTIPSNNIKINFGIEINDQIVLSSGSTVKGGLFRYSNGIFKRLNFPALVGNTKINAAKEIHGQLMLFTNNGIVYFSRGINKTPSVWFHGIACNDGIVDETGNLWISTKSKGLILIPRGKHKKLIAEPVTSVRFYQNQLLVGTNEASLLLLSRSGALKQRISNEALNSNVAFFSFDKVLNGYFVQNGILVNDNFIPLGIRIHGQYRSNNGTLYLATSKGLIFTNATTTRQLIKFCKNVTPESILIPDECISLEVNTDESELLCSTQKGTFSVVNNQVKELKMGKTTIRTLSTTWYKNAWYLVTINNNLVQIANGKVVSSRSLDKTGVVNAMKILGGENHIYLLTESGLYRTEGMKQPFESFHDVMGFDGVYIRDFCVDGDEVYLATQAGIFTYLWKNVKPQLAHFISGSPFNKDKKQTKNKRFTNGSLFVPIECIELTGNHNFHFQYRLINGGISGAWVEVMPEAKQLALSNLANGDYVLEMRMIDPVSGNSTEVQRQNFEVPTEWWQLKLLWISVGVALVLFVQWMMKKLREEKPKKKRRSAISAEA